MSAAIKLLKAAAGNAGGAAVYVDDVFSTDLWAANGSARNITNGVDLSGEGGLVWIKVRGATNNNVLYDTARGAGKQIVSNSTGAESTRTDTLTTFNNNGYALGADASYGTVNYTSNGKYVGWTFRKQPGFFDIQTYAGQNGHTQSHDLGSVPGMIVIKDLSGSNNWKVWHRSTSNGVLELSTSAALDTASFSGNVIYNVTSTSFDLADWSPVSNTGKNYVAYIFAHDAQDFGTNSDEAIIKCGTYTGNGSSTGPTVDLGFEPQWLLFKKATGSAEEWIIHDNMRGLPVGGNDAELLPASGSQEYSSYAAIDLTATGFKITHTSSRYNENSQTYIYMAIARPHKPASEFAATDLFTPVLGLNASGGGKVFATTYPVDLSIGKQKDGTNNWYVFDRMRGGGKYIFTDSTTAENYVAYQDQFDHMDGLYTTNGFNYTSWIGYQFRRAPGFFDVVVYKGTNSATTISHNLEVAPEMIWVKNRGAVENWQLYLNAGGTEYGYYGLDQKYVGLNTSLSTWNDTSPTSSVVSIATAISNASYSYVMYLFASVSGISKIGTYSGTGSELTVDCGFSAGARYVLIKRADNSMGSGGESYFVFDTVRGITASSSPYLPLNDTDAEASGSFVKPDSSGFKVTTESVVNTNGSTYVFYAIA